MARKDFLERQLIKKLSQSKEDVTSWTGDQIHEGISLLLKHVHPDYKTDLYYVIELHKKLLPVKPEICWEIGESLLEALSAPLAESLNKRIAVYRNNCYAYHWNYMRQEVTKAKNDLNLNICFLALRFSLTHTLMNIMSVVNRLQQCIQVTQRVRSATVIATAWEKLIDTLKNCLSSQFPIGKVELSQPDSAMLEEGFVQLALVLARHFSPNFTDFPGIPKLVRSIQDIAQGYIPTMRLDLTATHLCRDHDPALCLQTLADYLDKHRSLLTSVPGVFDVFEYKTPWKSWSQQWIFLKKDYPDLETTTVLDYLENDEMDEQYNIFLSKALRFEINSYFSWKIVLADGLISAGQALSDHSTDFVDVALGTLAEGIGFWFGEEEHEADALELCQETLDILRKGLSTRTREHNPDVAIVTCLAYAWIGMCTLRRIQTQSSDDLKGYKEAAKEANLSRDKTMEEDDGSRIISGISSITISEEFIVGTLLRKSADSFFRLFQLERHMKEWIKSTCPSMILITIRLVAHTLTSLGDSVGSLKAWHVVHKLSGFMENRFSSLFSGAELIKQVPNLDSKLVMEIEDDFKEAWNLNEGILKSARPYLWRLEIARSTCALYTKDYQNGLNQLTPLLHFRKEKDNYDISHHIMAETYFLLSQYRALDVSLKIDFSGVPPSLSEMSPVSLVTKAFKHLAGMARTPNYRQSGWSDILHNSFLLSSVMQMGPKVIEMLSTSGKFREMRIFAADFIFLTQQMGYVSRAIQSLLPLAEADMLAQHYDSCELTIFSLDKLFKGKVEVTDDHVANPFRRENVTSTLKNFGISMDYKKLVNLPDTILSIQSIIMPDYHYAKGDRNEDKTDIFSPIFHRIRTPGFLFHSLKCSCFICSHPFIVPLAIQYLHLLATYAVSTKGPVCKDLIQTASRHHLRGMFRILHNFPTSMTVFGKIFSSKGARCTLERTYLPFFFEPVARSLLVQMELVSPERIGFIVDAHKIYTEACNLYDPKDLITKHKSFDTLCAALFLYLFGSDHFEIRGSRVREILDAALAKNAPAFPDAHSPDLPPESGQKSCPVGPTKKGIIARVKRTKANADST